jgi:galactose-1-phosphate uridylyltransferase
MIEFRSVLETTRLVDPAGARAEQTIEHRVDPLTGTIASINSALGDKARVFLGAADLDLLRDLEQRSRAGCPFCDASEKGTRYPPELVPEGQLRVGGALAMPNLFSKAAQDSVVILDPSRHVLFPSRIGAGAFADGLRLAAELVRRARAHDAALVHHVAGMNFLQPGGSSVPHPHFQVHVRGVAYSGVARALERSAEFQRAAQRDYWSALLAEERRLGVRWIGATGPVEWIAAYAPAHQKEVWGVLPGVGSLVELGDAGAEGFAQGLARVLAFYEECGSHPFTFAFFSAPEPGLGGRYALHVRVCARPAFRALYSNYDTWFTPKFLGDDVHTEAPERYAGQLRSRF